MKIIDLFNKIANGEEVPKRICYKQYVYIFDEPINNYSRSWEGGDSTTRICLMTEISNFNDEIEIIEDNEEKEIEKLNIPEIKEYDLTNFFKKYTETALMIRELADRLIKTENKINELVEEVNKLKNN